MTSNITGYTILARVEGSHLVNYVVVGVDEAMRGFALNARAVVQALDEVSSTSNSIRSVGAWLVLPVSCEDELRETLNITNTLEDEVDVWELPQLDAKESLEISKNAEGNVAFGIEVDATSVTAFGYDYSDDKFVSVDLSSLIFAKPLKYTTTTRYSIGARVGFLNDHGTAMKGAVREIDIKISGQTQPEVIYCIYSGESGPYYYAEKDLWTASEAPPKKSL